MRHRRLWPIALAGLLLLVSGYGILFTSATIRRAHRIGEVIVVESDREAADIAASHPDQQASMGAHLDGDKMTRVLVLDPDPATQHWHDVAAYIGLLGLLIALFGIAVLTASGVAAIRRALVRHRG